MKTQQTNGPYNIVGYSFGAAVAFEMSLQLQKSGERFNLILLDGSHLFVKMFTSKYKSGMTKDNDRETEALCAFLERFTEIDYPKVRQQLYSITITQGPDVVEFHSLN